MNCTINLMLIATSVFELYLELLERRRFAFKEVSSLVVILVMNLSLIYFLFCEGGVSVGVGFCLLYLVFIYNNVGVFLRPEISEEVSSRACYRIIKVINYLFFKKNNL